MYAILTVLRTDLHVYMESEMIANCCVFSKTIFNVIMFFGPEVSITLYCYCILNNKMCLTPVTRSHGHILSAIACRVW
jgi:hypothetical protein